MKFKIHVFNKTPLFMAIEKGNIQMVNLLISIPTLDSNVRSVSIIFPLYNFKN
mgnify:CR=1 FL=1